MSLTVRIDNQRSLLLFDQVGDGTAISGFGVLPKE